MKEEGIFSKDHKEVVRKIRALRIEKGISQAELGKKLEKTQSYISKLESGQKKIDILEIKEIAKVLDKSVAYFLS